MIPVSTEKGYETHPIVEYRLCSATYVNLCRVLHGVGWPIVCSKGNIVEGLSGAPTTCARQVSLFPVIPKFQ